jgi:hypothetical protein
VDIRERCQLGTPGWGDFSGRPFNEVKAMTDWRWLRQIILRLRTLFQRDLVERELEEEFQFHIENSIEMQMARGLSQEEARSAALRALDGIEQHKEEYRDMRRVNSIRRSPTFSSCSTLTSTCS